MASGTLLKCSSLEDKCTCIMQCGMLLVDMQAFISGEIADALRMLQMKTKMQHFQEGLSMQTAYKSPCHNTMEKKIVAAGHFFLVTH